MTRGRILGAVALGALALAYALPMESVGCAQTSHYAATRSFAEGHPYIDRYANETCDLVRDGNHFYAVKGPAMDVWSVPWYLLLRSVGAVPKNPNADLNYPAAMLGVPLRAMWQLGLWAVVLPALGLLVLVRRTVERLEPGLGTAAAVILGLGTLVLPFSTLLFAHVAAAALAFLSFSLLFGRAAGPLRVAAAGAAAGLAVSTDLPLAVPAVLLGLYAASRPPHLRRLTVFGTGGVAGLLPLLAFDWWAFGSPFHLPYSGAALDPGAGGVEQSPGSHGFFNLQLPDFRVAIELLLSQRGLLVLTPVVAAGVAGTIVIWRRGLRAEALLIAALCVAEVTWNSGHNGKDMALGGWVPGPRYLIPLLPFLCFALAPALRRAPAIIGTLALVSAGSMVVATSAEPLLSNDDTHHWIARIADGNFTATVVSLTGVGHGWLAILSFYALVLVAAAAAVAATRMPVSRRDLAVAAAVLVGWIVVEHGAPALLQVDRLVHESYGLLAAIGLVGALMWALVRLFDGRPAAAAPGLLLLAFAARRFDQHTKWALLLAVLVLGALVLQP
ncbi:MAG: hypothetical protein ACXWYO_01910, partial [Gaiellaceae bacterium]